ncbi:MAG TPA: DUF308 domain-containing protein [Candidatus Dormibacteraeota bacterium]|nr:DUF308 domain-containing protein [Candidatus Dormibacteraeota bacterium]
MSSTSTGPGEAGKNKWISYVIRGVTGAIIAISLIQKFLSPEKASNYPIYMGVYFLANGVLSLKEARAATQKASAPSLAALTSVVGGIVLIFTYLLYSRTLLSANLYAYTFSAIVIIIGLLQLHHAVRMTPHPVLKRAHLVFGSLEVLLGVVVIIFSIDWQADAVALVWVVLVSIYMFYVAHVLRST